MSGACPAYVTSKYAHELNVFANMNHMHYVGKKQWTEQYRDGVFIGLIGEVMNYDFNSQKFVPISNVILPGDELITHCVWDSSKKNVTTVGGEATQNEMCVNALMYYPAIPALFTCWPQNTVGCECDYNSSCLKQPDCAKPVDFCGQYKNCSSCSSNPKCGWCDAPTVSTCFNKAAYTNTTCAKLGGKTNVCTQDEVINPCSVNSDCSTCNADTTNGCSWCELSIYSSISSICVNSTTVCDNTLGGYIKSANQC